VVNRITSWIGYNFPVFLAELLRWHAVGLGTFIDAEVPMKNIVAELRGAALAAAGAVLVSASALAQTPAPAEDATISPPAAQAPAAAAVEDKKIDQFADAYLAVQEIQVKANEQLGATNDATKADQVKQSAEDQMIKAVQRTGLQIDEFNQIVQAMTTDQTLRDRISDRIGERKRTS
jgi:hypothetical protein